MARRWGFGPVFARELVAGSRRWQVYAVRSAFAAALLLWLWLIWSRRGDQVFQAANELASVGQEFFVGLAVIQLSLVLLVAPASMAGALCVDKARGTLMHVLVTDLTDAEIVWGKLAARLRPCWACWRAACRCWRSARCSAGSRPMSWSGRTW